jgi:hypothetical protein
MRISCPKFWHPFRVQPLVPPASGGIASAQPPAMFFDRFAVLAVFESDTIESTTLDSVSRADRDTITKHPSRLSSSISPQAAPQNPNPAGITEHSRGSRSSDTPGNQNHKEPAPCRGARTMYSTFDHEIRHPPGVTRFKIHVPGGAANAQSPAIAFAPFALTP